MTPALRDALAHITTGTITTMLLKKGIRYEARKKLR
jgi:hypothetical protein